ncbi:DUF952 domain protein [Rutstroemia sp. NJR-2017a WRK4]|nr:DUF952 domain protein [Rutstroemia sp. NJR-2017a WRK4]
MATTDSTPTYPKYIYKILPSSVAPPIPLPDVLPVSELDSRDGFIHLSTSKQLVGTLNAFFSNESHVYLLRIPYSKVAPHVKWEDAIGKTPEEVGGCWDTEGKAGFFPHVYNGLRLGREEVDALGLWKRGEGEWGDFGEEGEGVVEWVGVDGIFVGGAVADCGLVVG